MKREQFFLAKNLACNFFPECLQDFVGLALQSFKAPNERERMRCLIALVRVTIVTYRYLSKVNSETRFGFNYNGIFVFTIRVQSLCIALLFIGG